MFFKWDCFSDMDLPLLMSNFAYTPWTAISCTDITASRILSPESMTCGHPISLLKHCPGRKSILCYYLNIFDYPTMVHIWEVRGPPEVNKMLTNFPLSPSPLPSIQQILIKFFLLFVSQYLSSISGMNVNIFKHQTRKIIVSISCNRFMIVCNIAMIFSR